MSLESPCPYFTMLSFRFVGKVAQFTLVFEQFTSFQVARPVLEPHAG